MCRIVWVSPSSLAKLSPKRLFVGSDFSNDYSSTTHIQKCQRYFFFPLKIQITSWNKQVNHLQLVPPSLFLFAQWSLHYFRSTYQAAITYQGPLASTQGRCFHCQTPVCCRTTIASRTYPLWISKYELECCVSYQVLHCNLTMLENLDFEIQEIFACGNRNPEILPCGIRNPGLWNPEYSSRDLESH